MKITIIIRRLSKKAGNEQFIDNNSEQPINFTSPRERQTQNQKTIKL